MILFHSGSGQALGVRTKFGLHFIVVDLGEVEIMENLTEIQRELVRIALHEAGLELMDDKRALLIERIKELIIYRELNITEIAWKMNYSSVAYLSN